MSFEKDLAEIRSIAHSENVFNEELIISITKIVREARKQTFLEAAELAENYETWNENIIRFAKHHREKADQ